MADHRNFKTLYGHSESGSGKTLILNSDTGLPSTSAIHERSKRDTPAPILTNSTIKINVSIAVYFIAGDNNAHLILSWKVAKSFVFVRLWRSQKIPGFTGQAEIKTLYM